MYLNLKTERPMRVVLTGIAAVAVVFAWAMNVDALAMGGEWPVSPASRVLEERLLELRTEQTVRSRREEILRAQLAALDHAQEESDEYRAVRDDLLALLLDERRAEEEIATSLRELWSAQGYAERASRRLNDHSAVAFEWPVEPGLGISAHFDDPGYRARFGFAHRAIDIPVNQDSIVRSVADGVVEKVSDQGYGFNSIVIRHRGGYASLYGHVSEFLVAEGDDVEAGEAIARSGGMPGTKGAGRITTGPHLHLELLHDGTHIDPLSLLPKRDDAK